MSSGHLHPQYNLRWSEELKNKIAESDGNQVALLQEEITLAMKDVMNNLVSNAVNNLLQQGVVDILHALKCMVSTPQRTKDENVVKNAFTSKPK